MFFNTVRLGSQFVYRQFDRLAAGSTVRNLNIDLAIVTDPAAVALGDVCLDTAAQRPNCSFLIRHIYFPQARVRHLSNDEREVARDQLGRGSALLRDRTDADANELRWASDVVNLALDDAAARLRGDGSLASLSAESRVELAERALRLETKHAELWPLRSRPGGLADSRTWFTRLREAYMAGAAPAGWPYPEIDLGSSHSA